MKNINILIVFVIFFSILNTKDVLACKYTSKINQCIGAVKAGNPKSIKDFVCISAKPEMIIEQVVVDMELKEKDDEIDKYLEELSKDKSRYFGKNAKKTFIEGIDDITKKSKDIRKEYEDIIKTTINEEVASCSDNKSIAITEASYNFSNDKIGSVSDLIDTKMKIFDDVSFSILQLNKGQVHLDEKNRYDQGQITKYSTILDLMMINIGYLERILHKWPSKLKKVYKG